MTKLISLSALLTVLLNASGDSFARKKDQESYRVCGDTHATCNASYTFQPHESPVEWLGNTMTSESKSFCSIVLKRAKSDESTGGDCNKVYTAGDIRSVQDLFPNSRMFAQQRGEPGMNFHTGVAGCYFEYVFNAVFAARTFTEANRFLRTVKATKQFAAVRGRTMKGLVYGS